MAPTLEAHGALATAIGLFKFSPFKAFLLSTLGTFLLIVPLLFFWHFLAEFFMKHFYFVNRFLTRLFSYTKTRHTHHFAAFGETEKNPSAKINFWKAFALYV